MDSPVTEPASPPPTVPAQLTEAVVAQHAGTSSPRLREVMTALVRHAHAFAEEVQLTQQEWGQAIAFLTATGQTCTDTRQEFILLSDVLGLSMLVDLLDNADAAGATETTVLGPFYVPESPVRANGDSTAEQPSGTPALVSGRVLDVDGKPVPGAEVDVWQNGANGLYAVQDPDAPATNLRGLFRCDEDGAFHFLGVRPTDYRIPTDGPVGSLLAATGRHPWRAAHLHLIVRAPGCRSVTTHLFDDESKYLTSDVVFGVKDSLVAHFEPHAAGEADRPAGIAADVPWFSLHHDIVLARQRS